MGKRWDNIKDVARDLPDKVHDEQVAQIRAHYYTRWAYICNQDRYASEDELKAQNLGMGTLGSMIDYSEPHVHIEWLLSDPQWQKAIKKPEGRERFMAELTEEERTIYMTEGYTDLENAHVTKEVGRAIKHQIKTKMKRKKKGEDIVEQV